MREELEGQTGQRWRPDDDDDEDGPGAKVRPSLSCAGSSISVSDQVSGSGVNSPIDTSGPSTERGRFCGRSLAGAAQVMVLVRGIRATLVLQIVLLANLVIVGVP